jgi:hypothetical protein
METRTAIEVPPEETHKVALAHGQLWSMYLVSSGVVGFWCHPRRIVIL